MTRKDKFQEEWTAVFGSEMPLPSLKCLETRQSDGDSETGHGDDAYTSSTKEISTGFDTIFILEDDLKTMKETLFRLRTELKAAKFCQDWLNKEIRKCRKVSEGLESIASDDCVTLTDDDEPMSLELLDDHSADEASLDSHSVDSCEKAESPPLVINVPPVPQRRPSGRDNSRNEVALPDAPDADSDSDSDDYEGIYENIALLQEKMNHVREQKKPDESSDKGREHLLPESGSDESPSGSPIPPCPLNTDNSQEIHEPNDEDFDTSFKTPIPADRQPAAPNQQSFTETEIDGGSSPELSTKKRQNTWKQIAAGEGRMRGLSPSIRKRPTILDNSGEVKSSQGTTSDNSNLQASQIQRRLTSPEVERLNIRRAILSTILDGEKKFIAGLEELVKISDSFRANMTLSEAFLTREEFDTLFFRIPELCDVHQSFLKRLEPKLANWSPELAFGDCFRYLASKFYIHEEYASNYKRAFTTLKEEKEEFRAIANNTRGRLPTGESLTLEALLHSPLHRITKLTLTIHDLLKHTPESHEDHRVLIYVIEKTHKFITEVTEAIQERSTTNVKKRSCQKHGYIVEWTEGERKLRYLFLWSDLLICANKRASGGVFSRDKGQFDCQWYLPLTELSLIPSDHSENSSKQSPTSETAKVDALKRELAELNTLLKKDMMAKQSRHHQREVEKTKKKVTELEAKLTVLSPSLPLHLYHHNGKTYTFLMPSDYEKFDWREAILSAKRECKVTPNLTLYHINKLLSKFKQGRQASVRSIVVSQDADLVTGTLLVTVVGAVGLKIPSELYCCIEVDAYGIFFLMAKTKKSPNTMTPEWNEDFDLEIDGAKTLRVICYDHTKGLEDEMIDKGQTVLKREYLKNKQEIVISMERIKVTLRIGFQSSAKTLKRVQSRKKVGVFGVRIGALTKREASDMPTIIRMCATEVEKRGISELGIYRISGSIADINRLKKAFETGHRSVTKLVESMDIHAVAGLLKLYLRELPEPLFTHSLYDKFTSGLTLSEAESKRKYMMSLLKSMPEPNRTTIIFLFNHLKKIASNETQNKMSLHNISTVFGPTLLSPAGYTDQDPSDISGFFTMAGALAQVGVLHYFLEHFSERALQLIESDSRGTV